MSVVVCVVCVVCVVVVFFFQAEDGIRDLVRSRGLGDVYKRQIIFDLGHQIGEMKSTELSELRIINNNRIEGAKSAGLGKVYFVAEFSKPFRYYGTFDASYVTPESVSYTHLTLPTSDLV